MQGRRYHPYGQRYDGLPHQHLWGSTDVWQAQGRNGLAGKFAWSLTLRFLAAWLLEGCWIVYSIIEQLNFSQGRIYSPMPHTLEELLQHAEEVIDDLNNNKQAMVVRSVHKMKAKAAACVAVGGGVFEGRKVWIFVPIWVKLNKWFEILHWKAFLGGTSSILRTFRAGPVKKNTLYVLVTAQVLAIF